MCWVLDLIMVFFFLFYNNLCRGQPSWRNSQRRQSGTGRISCNFCRSVKVSQKNPALNDVSLSSPMPPAHLKNLPYFLLQRRDRLGRPRWTRRAPDPIRSSDWYMLIWSESPSIIRSAHLISSPDRCSILVRNWVLADDRELCSRILGQYEIKCPRGQRGTETHHGSTDTSYFQTRKDLVNLMLNWVNFFLRRSILLIWRGASGHPRQCQLARGWRKDATSTAACSLWGQ